MIRAIDTLGQTIDYVQASRYRVDHAQDTIHLYEHNTLIAVVPGDWIVKVVPFSQVDPGVEARE